MKVNVFLTIIAVLLGALLGYLAYNIAEGKPNDVLCGIVSSLCFIGALIPTMGLQYESGRMGVNIRVMSALVLIIFLVSHFCFAGFGVKMPAYLIVNGLLLLLYFAIFYKMQGNKEV